MFQYLTLEKIILSNKNTKMILDLLKYYLSKRHEIMQGFVKDSKLPIILYKYLFTAIFLEWFLI